MEKGGARIEKTQTYLGVQGRVRIGEAMKTFQRTIRIMKLYGKVSTIII